MIGLERSSTVTSFPGLAAAAAATVARGPVGFRDGGPSTWALALRVRQMAKSPEPSSPRHMAGPCIAGSSLTALGTATWEHPAMTEPLLSPTLGRLDLVDPGTIWPHEAQHFSP